MANETAAEAKQQQQEEGRRRPPRPRASVPAFGGWDQPGGGAQQAPPDYSLDFTNIRATRMRRRTKVLSWSSFVGDAAANDGTVVVAEDASSSPGEDEKQHGQHRRWSSSPASDGDDDDDRRRRRRERLRRRGADDDEHRLPIQPRRAAPKGRGNFKGYLFGCVGGLW